MKTENWINGMTVYFYGNDIEKWEQICKDAEERKIPTITLRGIEYALIRHGKWIEHHKPYTWMGYTYWSCSECGFECGYEKDITIRTKYCPHCGAKMDEVNNEVN